MTASADMPSATPGILTSLRRRQCVSLWVLLACASLTLFGLDGLTSGHVHIDDGSLVHHRHLFDGAHSHEELQGHDDGDHDGDDHDDGDQDDEESPGRSRSGTVSTLEIASGLTAGATASLLYVDLQVVSLLDEPPQLDVSSRFSLTEGPRPPPGQHRA